MAIDSGGTFLAYAWCSGQDIYVRFFWPDGTPRTGGIRCNPTLDVFTQDEPAVSIDANGKAVVTNADLNTGANGQEAVLAMTYEVTGVTYYWPANPTIKWDGGKPSVKVDVPD